MKKVVSFILILMMMLLPVKNVFAIDNNREDNKDSILKTTVESNFGDMIEGSIAPNWLGHGKKVRYPAEGGTWEYGFWNLKVRSYYTVNKCHGSSVILNGKKTRSIDTAAGKTSIAEIWTLQHNGEDRYYYRLCK